MGRQKVMYGRGAHQNIILSLSTGLPRPWGKPSQTSKGMRAELQLWRGRTPEGLDWPHPGGVQCAKAETVGNVLGLEPHPAPAVTFRKLTGMAF